MSTREEVLSRHRKEQKDLVATITGLKKQATKKTRKNVINKCSEMQDELDRKHKEELNVLDGDSSDETEKITPEQLLAQLSIDNSNETLGVAENGKIISGEQTEPANNKPKRNRQKERLARKNAEIERIKAEAAKEAENTIDYRKIEQDSMNKLLALNNLQLYEIKPDGNCLFSSIQDQLKWRHSVTVDVQDLRVNAADYIQANSEDFIPFLFDENTGELYDLNKYLDDLKNTSMWGSDMEILALAKEFDCPISIFMAGASTVKINEEGQNPELKLGFYSHSYALGEHYNSLRDIH